MGSDPYMPYRKALLRPSEVKELSVLRPGRVVRDTAWCWAVIVAAWAATAVWPSWWMILLAIPVVGSGYYALSIIAHDGLHRRLFPARRTNDLYCDSLLLGPIGAITRLNNRNHLEHHRHLSTPRDPDRYKHGSYNKRTRTQLVLFLTGLPSAWAVFRNVFLSPARSETADGDASPVSAARYKPRDILIIALWQVMLLVGLTWAIGWWAYPILWLVPVYLFQYCPDLIRSFLEHAHAEDDALADAHRLITFTSSRIERHFLAPMNMNYHAAHHLWTSIPYYNLPEADRRIRGRAGAEGLVWRGSYLRFLLEYGAALPLPTKPALDTARDEPGLEARWIPRHTSSGTAASRRSVASE